MGRSETASPRAKKPSASQSAPVIACRPVDSLEPYAHNSRTHSDEQVAQLAASIDEFGMVGAIVIRDGTIAKGHGTLAAIRNLYAAGKRIYPAPGKAAGAKPYPDGQVPTLDASGWTDAQFRAFVIADNKLALNAGWDEALLFQEMGELRAEGIDLALTGFSVDEIAELAKLAEPPAPPKQGHASFNYQEKFAVLVECADEADQQRMYERLTADGLSCKVLVN